MRSSGDQRVDGDTDAAEEVGGGPGADAASVLVSPTVGDAPTVGNP